MSEFVKRVCNLISAGEVWISEHGYDELAEDETDSKRVNCGRFEGGGCRGIPELS